MGRYSYEDYAAFFRLQPKLQLMPFSRIYWLIYRITFCCNCNPLRLVCILLAPFYFLNEVRFQFIDFFFTLVLLLLSVSVPFRGDYVGLRRNPAWKDTLKRNRLHKMDQRVIYADIMNKMNRSNGKVGKSYFH